MTQISNSGLPTVADIPLGSHICHLYRTPRDLFDTLVPYFKAGLESHELCLWLAPEAGSAAEARAVLRDAVPDLALREHAGQIEILEHHEWYGPDDALDADRVLRGWGRWAARAARQGYRGLRVAGDTYWTGDEGWNRIVSYESKVGALFRGRRIIGLCSYCLDRCSGSHVVDIMRNHQLALARHQGVWETIANTELRAAHEEIARLLEHSRFRERVLGIVSHDMRDPLGSIALAADSLLQDHMLDKDTSKIIARIASSAERMTRLVRDLLDFTQAQLGTGLGLEVAPADLNQICRDVVEEMALIHPRREFQLDVCADGRGLWDRYRLTQALSNLVGNAVRHGAEGTPVRIETMERQRPDREVTDVIALVHNEGAPIPADLLPHIFAPFRRGREGSVPAGLGLGLFITEQIVSAHGGAIDVRSIAGQGTTFQITLPRWPQAGA